MRNAAAELRYHTFDIVIPNTVNVMRSGSGQAKWHILQEPHLQGAIQIGVPVVVVSKYRRPRDITINNSFCELGQNALCVIARFLAVELIACEHNQVRFFGI